MHNFACTRVRYIAINAYWKPLEFELPFVTGVVHGGWLRSMDTSLPTPDDIVAEGTAFHVRDSSYRVNSRSIVILDCDQQTSEEPEQPVLKGRE
jgi:glycogen operon protein